VRDEAARVVGHLVGQAAGLAAVAPVGAAAGVGVADEALAAIGHAQRSVDEKLDVAALGVGGGADGGNLLHRQLARQHNLAQARVLQKAGFFRGADVGLGAGVQLDGRQIEFEQAHVLDDEGVGPGVVDLPGHLPGAFEFIVAQDGVERDENAAVKAVGVGNQALQVAQVVACAGACTKGGAADVDGVGAVVDGLNADVGIARGGEEFELVGQQ
jgi:hypothetical protein